MEKLLKETIQQSQKKNSKYDCLVMFSGGKDSTFLAHYLKEIVGKKICLFSVDNSFENDFILKEVAQKLSLDLYVFKPSEKEIIKLYNFIISEKGLKDINSNPLCYLCNQYFSSLAVHFANQMGIPIVINGITMAQILGKNFPRSERLIKIALSSIKTKFGETYKVLQNTDKYKEDIDVKSIIDNVFNLPNKAKIVYPFLYLDYHIENIKEILEREYGWKNPDPKASNKEYASWGCSLANLFGILEKKRGYKTHELEQFELAYNNGTLSKEAYEYSKKNIEKLLTQSIDSNIFNIIKKLELENILTDTNKEIK